VAEFSPEARRRAVNALSEGEMFLALYRGDLEEDDPAYERQPVRFGFGQDRRGAHIVTNTDEVLFPAYERSTVQLSELPPIDNWRIYDGTGAEIARETFDPRKPQRTDRFVVRQGTIAFGMR
jgi:hypothetical protein